MNVTKTTWTLGMSTQPFFFHQCNILVSNPFYFAQPYFLKKEFLFHEDCHDSGSRNIAVYEKKRCLLITNYTIRCLEYICSVSSLDSGFD